MRNRYTNLGWFATIIVATIPVLLWLMTQQTDWSTAKLVAENLGKLAGLAGLTLFAWNVILSARLKPLGKLFMGLDNLYRAHHTIGSTALILLLIHPMLLVYRYLLSSPVAAYEFIKPSFAAPYRFLGSITLASMMLLMFLTLYINMKQEKFVLVQRLIGLLLFLGALHAVLVGGSDLRDLILLQIYILGLVAIAAVVYVYRSIFHQTFSKRYKYILETKKQLGDIIELYLKPVDLPLTYLPGQFAFIKFDQPGTLGQSHPFSISSSPNSALLRFSIKQLGDYTEALSDIKLGTAVSIDAPYGSYSNKIITAKRQVWIAGGIGITPFLSMVGDLTNSGQQIDLFYSVKSKGEDVYLTELQAATKNNPQVQVIPYYTDTMGYLTADYIVKNCNNLDSNTEYMICGPASMMKSMRTQLRSMGISNTSIQTEEFSLL